MISKVVIPAAGKGTRMLDLAKDRPKHLISVLDKPFIYYVLKNLQNAGFTEMVLVIGHHAEKMREFSAGIGREFPLTLIDQFEVMGTAKYGTAIPVLATQRVVGNEQFVCIYGDNLYSPRDLAAIRELDDDFNYVSLLHVPNPEKYGVPIMEGDKVVDFVEKPKEWLSDYIIPGLYIYDNRVIEVAKKVKPSDRGEIEIVDLHNWYLEKGELEVGLVKGKWLDAGTFDSLLEAGQYVKEKKLYEKFDPIINQAIVEFNEELKNLVKKKL